MDWVCGRGFSDSGEALAEAGVEFLAVEISADEDQLTAAEFTAFPGTVCLAFEEHVDALEDETFGGSIDIKNSLHAEDVGSLGLEQCGEPLVETLGVEGSGFLDADAGDGLIVGVGVTAVGLGGTGFQEGSLMRQGHGEFIGAMLREAVSYTHLTLPTKRIV